MNLVLSTDVPTGRGTPDKKLEMFGGDALLAAHPEAHLVVNGEAKVHHFRAAVAEQALLRGSGARRPVRAILEEWRYLIKGQKSTEKAAIRDAEGAALHLFVPSRLLSAHQIILHSLENGVLRYSSMYNLKKSVEDEIVEVIGKTNFVVDKIVPVPMNRATLRDEIRKVSAAGQANMAAAAAELLEDPEDGSRVERAFNALISEAVGQRASDITLDLYDFENRAVIQYCIDGDMFTRHILPLNAVQPIAGKIKLDARLHDGNKHIPQDGRFARHYAGRRIDFRVAVGPAQYGETFNLRVLDPTGLKELDDLLAYNPLLLNRLNQTLKMNGKGGGAILATGPTGTGKSTTLTAMIAAIDRMKRRVLAAEDPIEFLLRDVDQFQILELPGRTFSDMVRHFLRQNPHVIVVGETRDSATALQLLQAIESGHLSLTSLHSVTCGEGWARLINLLPEEVRSSGIRTLGANLTAIINNRLGRRVCQNCAKPIALERAGDHIDPSYLAALECPAGTQVLIASEAGCEICHHTSHIGRTLVTESIVMPIDHAHREAVVEQLNRGSSAALRQTLGDHYQSRQHVAANLLLQRVIDVREYGTLCQA